MTRQGEHGIAWCDETWNPIRGCSRVSAGCVHCYAERMAARFASPGQPYEGLAKRVGGEARWTGEVRLVENALTLPLRWRKPRRVFVNSMSDLFHERVPDEWIDRIFTVMAKAPWHKFIVLTKRPERMRDFSITMRKSLTAAYSIGVLISGVFPLPSVWLGVSVEDQATADARIPVLLETPAAVRFISAEPMLGPVDFSAWIGRLDWVICGGESGPGARPLHPEWVRTVRDQCRADGVPFFFKQWGAWRWGGRTSGGWYYYPSTTTTGLQDGEGSIFTPNGPDHDWGDGHVAIRVGEKAAGAVLDGREHREFPQSREG